MRAFFKASYRAAFVTAAAVILVFSATISPAEEIRLSTIIPGPQATQRAKHLAVGTNYSSSTYLPEANFTDNPDIDVLIEGSVGIGAKTVPAYNKLEVNGGWLLVNFSGATSWGDSAARIGVCKTDNTGGIGSWHMSQNNDGKFAIHQAAVGDRLIIDGSGNVGIGTTPQAKLHIGGTAGTDGIMFPDGTLQTTAGGGTVVQLVYFETGEKASGTTAIPFDNTIPQQSEGTQFMSATITPKDANDVLKIDVVCHTHNTGSAASYLNVALFKDNISDAVASAFQIGRAEIAAPVNFTHYIVAGTTSAITFKVRAGGIAGTTTYFNSYGPTSWGYGPFGGNLASTITITELRQ